MASSTSRPVVAARKKPNFLDILKEAEKVDAEKLKMNVKVKDKRKVNSKPISASAIAKVPESVSKARPILKPVESATKISTTNLMKKAIPESCEPREMHISTPVAKSKIAGSGTRAPVPFAKPMDGLRRKRKPEYGSEEEDLDDFVVSDDDRDDSMGQARRIGPGYDRDEIWNMFNPGRKRHAFNDYYNGGDGDDDAEMEATGFDVLREEQHSYAAARKEDEKEEQDERRRIEAKRRRLKQ
ncbi:SPT2 chromatin protein-domain-containing protein [Lipomyces oligophaga]|uniref:SPT2 chromatin protein-domain-containing protein n=1 Tax=Lipomyces oligophaga TaxID=45792 RepID=UPI0034CD0B78